MTLLSTGRTCTFFQNYRQLKFRGNNGISSVHHSHFSLLQVIACRASPKMKFIFKSQGTNNNELEHWPTNSDIGYDDVAKDNGKNENASIGKYKKTSCGSLRSQASPGKHGDRPATRITICSGQLTAVVATCWLAMVYDCTICLHRGVWKWPAQFRLRSPAMPQDWI